MRKSITIMMVVAGALVLAACGGDSSTSDADTGAAIPGAGDAEGTIAVSVGESGSDSMYLRLSQETAAAGSVTFVVTNEGQKEHEFIVMQTDTPAGDFAIVPEDESMSEEMGHQHDFDEDAPGITVVDEVADLAAGATEELTVTLDPGHYALVCNIKPHYQQGMWADFEVT
ncbi:MAG: sulfocyanin-like copper-binding protein [Actinomycetota bacterium]|nr:sulfocyanin-like copper-binding protein [Actinomycetota bacterium]MDH5223336.1 sulfocyanin-like copper-binding protein [Actinomycetota bacterium]MDH5312422.1 sulfocyanin-like copper-binding protein [Actinomycetota bacterium]